MLFLLVWLLGGGNFFVWLRGLCRVGIDVPRFRWPVRLPARGVWRPSGVSLRLDAVQRRQRRLDCGAGRRRCGLHGTSYPSDFAGARCAFVRGHHVDPSAPGWVGVDRCADGRQRDGAAMGSAAAECFYLDQIRCYVGVRDFGICHRQGTLVKFQLSSRRADDGSGAVAIGLCARSRIDRRVLGLRRMGLYHVGGGRSERAAPQCSAGDGVGHARRRRDLSGDERDLRLCHAAKRSREA